MTRGPIPVLFLAAVLTAGPVLAEVLAAGVGSAMEPTSTRLLYLEVRDPRLARVELRVEGPDLKVPMVRTLRAKDNAIAEWVPLPVGRGQTVRITVLNSKGQTVARGAARADIDRERLDTVLINAASYVDGPTIGIVLATHRVLLDVDKEQLRVAARILGPDNKPITLAKDQAAWIQPGDPKFLVPFDPRRWFVPWKGNPDSLLVPPCLCIVGQPCACPRQLPPIRYLSITAGHRHACAIDDKGKAYCWGEDHDGQLGAGTTSALCNLPGYPYPLSLACSTTPVTVQAPVVLTKISAGGRHTCALDAAGAAYCWGSNREGQLGFGPLTTPVTATATPRAVAGSTRFTAISAGGQHTCALGTDSLVYCWGSTQRGQAGTSGPNVTAPRAVSTTPFRALSAGPEHSCGITSAGEVQCWGRGIEGQLGHAGSVAPVSAPTPQVASVVPAVTNPSAIAAGGGVTCVGSATAYDVTLGSVTCFGINSTVPAGAQRFFSMTRQLTAGGDPYYSADTACVINPSGTAHCWGSNASGLLGVGASAPVVVAQPTPVVQPPALYSEIDAGTVHVCAIANDSRVFCWGANGSGQLGNGTQVDAQVPAVVSLPYLTPSRIVRPLWP